MGKGGEPRPACRCVLKGHKRWDEMGERGSEARPFPDRGRPAHTGLGKKGLAIIVLVSIVAFIFYYFFLRSSSTMSGCSLPN